MANQGDRALVFFLVSLLIFSSCEGDKSNSIEVDKFKLTEVSFSIDSTVSTESNTMQYFKEDAKEYLVFFNKPTEEIVWFDFEKKKIVNKTKLYTDGPNNIGKPFGFHVKSIDSIFVLSSATYSLALVNNDGELLNNFKLFRGKLSYNGFPEDSENSIKPILQSTNPLLVLSDSTVALAGLPDANPLNTDFYDSKVFIKLNLNSGVLDYEIPYPERYQNKIWGLYHSFPFHTYNEYTGKAIISFPASDKIYQTDFHDTDSISVSSNYIEEPSSWKSAEAKGLEMMRFFMDSDSFYRIIYDPYQNLYFRFVQSSTDFDFSNLDRSKFSIFNTKTTYLSILNENFDVMSEFEIPKQYDPRHIFVGPTGLFISKENVDENRIFFDVFNFTEG